MIYYRLFIRSSGGTAEFVHEKLLSLGGDILLTLFALEVGDKLSDDCLPLTKGKRASATVRTALANDCSQQATGIEVCQFHGDSFNIGLAHCSEDLRIATRIF